MRPRWMETTGMTMHKICDLVYDKEIYPRLGVDWSHVQRMLDAAEAGVGFPPIIIEKKTRRVVDGWHRSKMAERLLGPNGEIACIEKQYADQAEYFLDTIRYNSEHGLAMSAADRFRSLEIGAELHVDAKTIAAALSMSVRAAASLSMKAIEDAQTRRNFLSRLGRERNGENPRPIPARRERFENLRYRRRS